MKAKETKNSKGPDIINRVGLILIIAGIITVIIRIWIRETWVTQILLTEFIIFVGIVFLYWVLYYEQEDK